MNNTVIKRITRKLNIYSNVQFDARNVQLSIKKANNREKKRKNVSQFERSTNLSKKKERKKERKEKGKRNLKRDQLKEK